MSMPLPPPPAIARLLSDLVGRPVVVKVVAANKTEMTARSMATYLDTSNDIRAVAFCDLSVGASLGAALVVVPPAVVEDCIAARQLDGALVENLYEVFNVLSAVFPQNGAKRVILRELNVNGAVPDDVKPLLTGSGTRLDLEINVSGYRSGHLAMIVY